MTISVKVFRDGDYKKIKDETFNDPIDLIAWVCRCYQATRRAAEMKVVNAKVEAALKQFQSADRLRRHEPAPVTQADGSEPADEKGRL